VEHCAHVVLRSRLQYKRFANPRSGEHCLSNSCEKLDNVLLVRGAPDVPSPTQVASDFQNSSILHMIHNFLISFVIGMKYETKQACPISYPIRYCVELPRQAEKIYSCAILPRWELENSLHYENSNLNSSFQASSYLPLSCF
jgi:hypothetical protein